MTAAGRVSPNSSTSLTAMMLETISVEAEAATTSGYQRGSALAVPLAMLRLDRDGDPPAPDRWLGSISPPLRPTAAAGPRAAAFPSAAPAIVSAGPVGPLLSRLSF